MGRSKVARAEACYRDLLVGAEHTLDPDNPNLLCAKNIFGMALRLQDKKDEAEALFRSALEASESSSQATELRDAGKSVNEADKGAEELFVCQLRMNLAMTLKENSKNKREIETHFMQADDDLVALEARGVLRGNDAVVLHFRQCYAEFLLQIRDISGEGLWMAVLVAKEKLFGEEDRRTLACKQALAECLAGVDLGSRTESNLAVDAAGRRIRPDWRSSPIPANRAAGLLEEVMQARENILAATNREEDAVLLEGTQVKLAKVLMNKAWPPDLPEGEMLLRLALDSRSRRLGAGDPTVLDLRWVLGACLSRQNKRDAAAVEFKICWEARRQLLGPNHPETRFAERYYRQTRRGCCSVQ